MNNAIKIIAAVLVVGAGIYVYTKFSGNSISSSNNDKDDEDINLNTGKEEVVNTGGGVSTEPTATTSTSNSSVVVGGENPTITVNPSGISTYNPPVPEKPLQVGDDVITLKAISTALVKYDKTIDKANPYSTVFTIPANTRIGKITKITSDKKAIINIIDSPTYQAIRIPLMKEFWQIKSAIPPVVIKDIALANQTTIIKLSDLKR